MVVARKQSMPNFPKNEHFLPLLFFGKFGVFCFLETTVLKFALLFYYLRIISMAFKSRGVFRTITNTYDGGLMKIVNC